MVKTTTCKNCGGIVIDDKQKYHHYKKCLNYKQENVDHLVCKVCGFRCPVLARHLRTFHNLSSEDYCAKYTGSKITLESLAKKRALAAIGTHIVPIEKRVGCVVCEVCGDKYLERDGAAHVQSCLEKNPGKHAEGKTFVRCTECGYVAKSLSAHLKKIHGWTRIQIQSINTEAKTAKNKFKESMLSTYGVQQPFQSAAIKAKREKTWVQNHGADNPWKSKEVQERVRQTNRERFGVDYPMQCADIQIKQYRSSKRGLSDIESKFIELICSRYPNVVFTGYGGRVINFKRPVLKNGRLLKCGNPDFMVFPDYCLAEVAKQSEALLRIKASSRFVIELFGDWFHGEKMIGVSMEEHKHQVIDAYKSAGIECLVLWGSEIKDWESIKDHVESWVQNAIFEINDGLHSETWRGLPVEQQQQQIEEFINKHPDVPVPSFGKARYDFDQLLSWNANPSKNIPNYGQICCRHFIRSMNSAKPKGLKTLEELWANKEILREALNYQLTSCEGFQHPQRMLNAVQFKNGFRSISNLMPAQIIEWLRKYAVKGGIFYDPCAGWGGRMLAAHCLGMRYRAIDANPILVGELNKMAEVLKIDAKVVYGDAEDHNNADAVLGGELVDLAFTSLPYYDKEWYCDDPNQSIRKYPDKKIWMATFPGGIFMPIVHRVSQSAHVILNAPLEISINDTEEQFIEMKSARSMITEKLIHLR